METTVALETLGDKWPGVGIINVMGCLDVEGASTLESYLSRAREKGLAWIIVNLADTPYVNSAGWGVFTGEAKCFRELGGDIKLAELRPDVWEIFDLMELEQIIEAHETVVEALEVMQREMTPPDLPSTPPTPPAEKFEATEHAPSVASELEDTFAGIVEFGMGKLMKEGRAPTVPQNGESFDISEPDWLNPLCELIDQNGAE
ncbi:MAG: STAS domain-containing protein [bacterium]